MYPILDYILNSFIQSFLFVIVFVVFLRGFLGLWEDHKKSKQIGGRHFAWFTLRQPRNVETTNNKE